MALRSFETSRRVQLPNSQGNFLASPLWKPDPIQLSVKCVSVIQNVCLSVRLVSRELQTCLFPCSSAAATAVCLAS